MASKSLLNYYEFMRTFVPNIHIFIIVRFFEFCSDTLIPVRFPQRLTLSANCVGHMFFFDKDNVNWVARSFHYVEWFPDFLKSKWASSPRCGSIENMVGNSRLDYAGWGGDVMRRDAMEVLPWSALPTLCREHSPSSPAPPPLPRLCLSRVSHEMTALWT